MNTILQSQVAECGLACIAMVASAHGQTLGLADLRQRFPQSLKGNNLKQLISYSSVLGFSARPLRLDLEELGQLVVPDKPLKPASMLAFRVIPNSQNSHIDIQLSLFSGSS